MAARLHHSPEDRIKAALCVALLISALGYGLWRGLGAAFVAAPADALKLFAVAPPPPPPPPPPAPVPRPEPARRHRPNGAASKANLRATAAPVVVPPTPPKPVPQPVVAAPRPAAGVDFGAGAAERRGPGSGAGGEGRGTGSGDAGEGTGDGDGTPPELIRGAITARDYPGGPLKVRIGGTVRTRFTVDVDGRVRGCVVTRSSGNADLDATTCRLMTERFRFAPARDGTGRAIADEAEGEYRWSTNRRAADEDDVTE